MLRKKALKKIFITTVTIFIILVIYLIPTRGDKKSLETNFEIEYITNIGEDAIYLLNNDNYLVKTNVLLTEEELIPKIKTLINYLTESNANLVNGLKGVIPKETVIIDIKVQDQNATINFSKDILTISANIEERMIEAITYSLCELEEIDSVIIMIDDQELTSLPHSNKKLPSPLTSKMGINKQYHLDNVNNYSKVTIYYLNKIDSNEYYVPVTKYTNDLSDKIKIIIESLASNYIYEPNLMSYLNSNVKLLDYNIENNYMSLNFNDEIFNNQGNILEEVIYTISYSIDNNYDDLSGIIFKVEGEEIYIQNLNDLK